MRKLILLFLLIGGTFLSGNTQKLNHVLGEIIVQVDNDRQIQNLINTLKYKHLKILSTEQICREPLNLWLIKSDPSKINEKQLLEEIIFHPSIVLAQFNHLINYRNTIPNDPEFPNQWEFINNGSNGGKFDADMDIDEAWDITTGGFTANGDRIVACIIDDGIFKNHEDFKNQLWVNKAEIPKNGIDDDNNGWVDDYVGWDVFQKRDSTIFNSLPHGTPVAGIIGAVGNNNIGVSGINWDIDLMIVNGGGNEAIALASYAYPYYFRKKYNETNGQEGALVVTTNASWGTDHVHAEEAPIWCEFYDKMGEIGILSCGATTNSNTNVDIKGDLPTSCTSDFLISVTNINKQDGKEVAGYGVKSIDLGAYGSKSWTTKTNNHYNTFGGASAATPHVTGAVALLYSIPCQKFATLITNHPDLAARFIKHVILTGTEPLSVLKNITVTGGKLNIKNSMDLAMAICENTHYPTDGIITDKKQITWTKPINSTTTNLRYKEEENNTWIEKNNIQSGYQFENLSLCTKYVVELQSVYPGNIKSEYSFAYKFLTTGCCYAPTDLNYENIEGTSDVTISWVSYFESTSNTIQYKNTEDIQWISTNTTDFEIKLTNLKDCSFFMSRLSSSCDTNNSIYSDTLYFSTPCGSCTKSDYCTSGNPDNSSEWIQKVKIHTLENNSTNEQDGYGNFLGFNIPELTTGETYEITLAPGYKDDIYSEYFRVWIDFNHDQIFTDDEVVFDNGDATKSEITGIVNIPITANIGVTRMRVSMRFQDQPKSCDDSNFEFGEIEDYCVSIRNLLGNQVKPNTLNNFFVYPNPFSNEIELEINSTQSFKSLVIKNIQGSIILQSDVNNLEAIVHNNGSSSFSIKGLERIPTGVYFISLKSDTKIKTIRIVKI